ncbi:MAG TPA: PPC domain-containing protein, partial [Thermoanaerobaculia bacterium]
SGLVPAPINDVGPIPPGTRGELVAFGRTRRELADQGIKRTGPVIADPCGPDFLCWWLSQTPDPGASLAGLCFHDSGGAVLADLPGAQGGPWLVGVNQSTSSDTCLPPSFNLATGLYSRREWLAEASGGDLGLPPGTPAGEGCGDLAAVGGAASRIRGATGPLSDDRREAGFYVDVPPGTGVLRVTLTATGRVEPADNDFDLYLRRGAMPDPEDPDGPGAGVDCASTGPSGVEACEIRSPGPGAWYALVRWAKGDGRYQLVATQLDGEPPPEEPEPEEPEEPEEPAEPGAPGGPAEPPPPELPWLTAPGFPGFEAKVRIGAVAGASVTPCVSESLCVSGALPGRPEVFVKVVGPRPNGHLWVQVARFTPARVEIWLRRTATGRVNHYVLDPVGPASPGVPGLQDRLAFPE